jgi:uncharacterized protein (DUF885 family)
MEDPNAAAREFAATFWEDVLELEPMIGTMVGEERFDDKLADPGPGGRARSEEIHRRALDEARRFDRELSEDSRTTVAVIEAISSRQLARLEHRIDRFDAVTHLFGPAQLLADFGSMQRADTPERLERYVTRLSQLPGYLDEVGRIAQDAAAVGQTVPKLVVDRSIAQVERLLATPPEDSPGVVAVPEDHADGRQRVADVLREKVWPAYDRYLAALRAYRPHARETIGLYALQGGDAIYAADILAFTSLPLEPEKVHQLGLEDFAKIQDERMEIARSLGYPDAEAAVAAYTASGRNTAKTRQELVQFAEGQVQRGWDAAPRYFGRLPQANCEVRPVEEFREDDVPGAFYQPPNADNTRPGVYYINCSSLDQRLLHQIASTTYHEANPGHHFQISIEQEYSDRPAIRRFGGILAGSAFAEGWGLYSERLADEMGLFLDEYERLGMLEGQGWRACRLIVDTGIHALQWDRERSVKQMMESGVPRVDAEIEVDRYIAWPGQALSYKIGQFEIEKWRASVEKRQGVNFSIKQFHDRVLKLGSLPLPALQAEMEDGTEG